ncbi:MAG: Transcription-repair coupling factor, partial [Frankiales bacterium]|nr:Transcription-repair coupling factor [Frankiales bacterium]
PHAYVPGERLRLEAYRRLASATDDAAIDAVRAELVDRYGPVPTPVENLLAVARFRAVAKSYGLTEVALQGSQGVRFAPLQLKESQEMRLKRLYPGTVVKPAVGTALVPTPKTARVGGQPLRDVALLEWAGQLLEAVLGDSLVAAGAAAAR